MGSHGEDEPLRVLVVEVAGILPVELDSAVPEIARDPELRAEAGP